MELGLQGRVALITGGTGHAIGRGIAEALLAEGALVAITGRSAEKGKETLEELGAGERAVFLRGDVTNRDDVESWVAQTAEHYGRLDILVNNAGGAKSVRGRGRVHEMPLEAWDATLALNLNSTFWATRKALPHMLDRGWGRIINMSSIEAFRCNKRDLSHYITNKYAIIAFTRAVAFEYGNEGVTCNVLVPGPVETDAMRINGRAAAERMGIPFEEFLDNYVRETMINRMAKISEVAAMAAFIASDHGAGITGAAIPVDGGASSR